MENILIMKNNILKRAYNSGIEDKKVNRRATIIISSFSLIVCLTAIIANTIANYKLAQQVKVVNAYGKELDFNLEYQEDLFNIGVKSHINRALIYANSFSRETRVENQKMAQMLMSKESLLKIVENFKLRSWYHDAKENGHQFEVIETRLTELKSKGNQPFQFSCQAILEINRNNRKERYLINGGGQLFFRKPTYKFNESGLWIVDYKQTLKKISDERI